MKRPTRYDDNILKALAEDLYPEVKDWLQDDDYSKEDVVGHLIHALDDEVDNDGYARAKQLEDHYYYDPDSRLVEILNCHNEYKILSKHIKSWVEENNIQPTFKMGSKVSAVIKGKSQVGEIVKIDTKLANYYVYVEGLCVPKDSGFGGTQSYVLPYEKVAEVPIEN